MSTLFMVTTDAYLLSSTRRHRNAQFPQLLEESIDTARCKDNLYSRGVASLLIADTLQG